ncbi:MAG: hypothetical protein CMJ83_22195 [Planctomycetes bacterium]|nr:hypothetical protein [Planctomycetota bacterium]
MDVVTASVLFNHEETPSVFRLGLAYDALARSPRAARFVMLAYPGRHLIPRPFSISDVYRNDDGVVVTEVLYKPIGRVTTLMSRLGQGERVRIGGLLGNGFPAPADGRRPVLLAGGIGNAPFAYQVRELLAAGFAADPSRIVLLLAGRSAQDLWIQDHVRAVGVTVVEVTDDGSRGETGRITDALVRRLDELGPIEAYVCGPAPMLRAVQDLAREHGFPCWISVEERMACGYGVCNACVVERCEPGVARGEGAYLKSCVEGPVFEAQEIQA